MSTNERGKWLALGAAARRAAAVLIPLLIGAGATALILDSGTAHLPPIASGSGSNSASPPPEKVVVAAAPTSKPAHHQQVAPTRSTRRHANVWQGDGGRLGDRFPVDRGGLRLPPPALPRPHTRADTVREPCLSRWHSFRGPGAYGRQASDISGTGARPSEVEPGAAGPRPRARAFHGPPRHPHPGLRPPSRRRIRTSSASGPSAAPGPPAAPRPAGAPLPRPGRPAARAPAPHASRTGPQG